LMPLSAFATILGGMTTLIGTPANHHPVLGPREELGAPFGYRNDPGRRRWRWWGWPIWRCRLAATADPPVRRAARSRRGGVYRLFVSGSRTHFLGTLWSSLRGVSTRMLVLFSWGGPATGLDVPYQVTGDRLLLVSHAGPVDHGRRTDSRSRIDPARQKTGSPRARSGGHGSSSSVNRTKQRWRAARWR
jgi:hypothetical protein